MNEIELIQPMLSQDALNALNEARARKTQQEELERSLAKVPEKMGREGPEPVRYGDWEHKGRAFDF